MKKLHLLIEAYRSLALRAGEQPNEVLTHEALGELEQLANAAAGLVSVLEPQSRAVLQAKTAIVAAGYDYNPPLWEQITADDIANDDDEA